MVNGTEVITYDGDTVLLAFGSIAYIRKTVTSGTACFDEKNLGKPALFIVLSQGQRTLWVTDPGNMEKLWGAFKGWTEGPKSTPLSV